MFRKISLLVFLSIPLIILADDHGNKEGKSPKEMKKMEMMKKKKDDMMKEMERWGRWKPEDCKKVSEASLTFLQSSGFHLPHLSISFIMSSFFFFIISIFFISLGDLPSLLP